MLQTHCDEAETPVQLKALDRKNETEDSLPSLTGVVQSWGSWQGFGGIHMPSVKLTVKLSFASGEELLTSVETPATWAPISDNGAVPYARGDATVPEQPILVSSSDFVQVG